MSDRNETPAEMVAVGGNAPPSWLAAYNEDDTSKQELKKHRLVPRLKILQGLSPEALKDQFGEGSAILAPANAMVCRKRESFLFVPLFFFVEYIKWSDRNDKESLGIVERTFDQGSALARYAQDPNKREELYDPERPTGYKYTYQEHLNFIGYIYGAHELEGTEVAISFSKGEHRYGKAFVSACTLRDAPLWANVFELTIGQHSSGDNVWWGIDFKNPEDPTKRFITAEEAPVFKEQFETLKRQFEEQTISTDFSDVDEDRQSEVSAAASTL